jgi:hypothetical protein
MKNTTRTKKSMNPGGGGRFKKLVAELKEEGNVTNPGAVAASIGRKKYGAKKFNKMAKSGKVRAKKGEIK